MIIIVDYGMGNLRSVLMKFERLNLKAKISRNSQEIQNADKLILPGVGHFALGMKNIYEFGIYESLCEAVLNRKVPILGICLGMQLLTMSSEEGNVKGLEWIEAETRRFNFTGNTDNLRIPHVGWNNVSFVKESILFQEIPTDTRFYFTHSYAVQCKNSNDSVGESNHGYNFTSVIQKGNIYGTQFHPEKSHLIGLKLIENFVSLS